MAAPEAGLVGLRLRPGAGEKTRPRAASGLRPAPWISTLLTALASTDLPGEVAAITILPEPGDILGACW